MPVARRAVFAVATVAVVGGILLAPAMPDWRLLVAVVAVSLAQVLRLRFRAHAAVFYVAWGEAALIIALYLVPAGWLPVTFLVGTALAIVVRVAAEGRRLPPTTPQVLATLSIAGGVGAAISYAVADPYGGPVTGPVVVGLVLASVGYLLVTAGVTSVLAAIQERTAVLPVVLQAIRRKLLMFGGNVAVGLVVVASAAADWRWLLGLPLVLTLLHATYASRLRVIEHRRMWRTFARATRSLNQPDEEAVAVAGLRGAQQVFAVGHVELELDSLPHGVRRWVGERTGEIVRRAPRTDGEPAGVAVPLLVAGEPIGTLRVHFPSNAGPGSGDDAALQAYADAVAAALHDTVTHAELHQLLTRSAHDAQHDPLTGLLNRATLMTRGETAIQLVSHARPVALLLVDVDHFREINDTLGHAAGDEVLRTAAARLQAATRPGELLARLGGDEFALLVTDPAPGPAGVLPEAIARGRELAGRLAAPADIEGVSVSIEASVGVVVAPAGTAEVSELLRRADAALWEAKQGSEPVGWYDGERDPGSTDRPALLAELRSALHRDDELVLLLQPVIDLRTGAPVGVEALARWRHPRRGVLTPGQFIQVVENSDLLGTFTEYVIDKAMAAVAMLSRHGNPLPVAVNLSARSLLDPGLPRAIDILLRRHRLPGRQLVLEITETVMTRELPGIEEALAALRALGVRLAVDDFGTGYASLTFLTRVPLDEVKVDGTLVAAMVHSPQAAAVVRTTVELGRELGLQVVAEGVETAAQREMLVELGCVAAQGFHFAGPTPVEQISRTLRDLESAAPGAQVIPFRRRPADQARLGDG